METTTISYEQLQEVFDTMFNSSMVCTEETMVQYIRDTDAFPGRSQEEIEERVRAFIDDTYNG